MLHDSGIVGIGPNTRAMGVERRRVPNEWEVESPSPFPFLLESWEGEVFIISSGRACIYKRAFKGYKWALNTTLQAPCYVIGPEYTTGGPQCTIRPQQ